MYNVLTVTNPVAYTFDDVWLVPQYSEVESRRHVSTTVYLSNRGAVSSPLIAANMDTVCEDEMVCALLRNRLGTGIIHRYNTIEERVALVRRVIAAMGQERRDYEPFGAAVGVSSGVIREAVELTKAGASFIVVDVAHGHHKKVGKAVLDLCSAQLAATIIAGNVATGEGALFLADHGAEVIKVGIGCGSICSTRLVTGHGVPQFSAILDCKEALADAGYDNVRIIADGGIRTSGDVLKALVAGADAVMVGSLFAGTTESPGQVIRYGSGKVKEYRGMASRKGQEQFYKNSPDAPEGVCTLTPFKGSVVGVASELLGGIRSGISYSGASSLEEFKKTAKWVVGTFSGAVEAQTVKHIEV